MRKKEEEKMPPEIAAMTLEEVTEETNRRMAHPEEWEKLAAIRDHAQAALTAYNKRDYPIDTG